MPRFYIPPHDVEGRRFRLTGSEARHALRVRRLKIGDEIELFDGRDRSYRGRIESAQGDRLAGTLLEVAVPDPSVHLPKVILGAALLKGPKWDWLIEKACEIGVRRLIPLQTQRTVIHVDGSRQAHQSTRWNRIALEAAKQCGRPTPMLVDAPLTLAEALKTLPKDSVTLIPWEKERSLSVAEALKGKTSSRSAWALLVGPEGGWEEREVETARRAGATAVRLGPTLLRSETAGLAAALLVLRELGVY